MDMAVGIIIGAAFAAIVGYLVADLITQSLASSWAASILLVCQQQLAKLN